MHLNKRRCTWWVGEIYARSLSESYIQKDKKCLCVQWEFIRVLYSESKEVIWWRKYWLLYLRMRPKWIWIILCLCWTKRYHIIRCFPIDEMIKYRNLVIDPKYRAVILNGKHIELINYEFEILHLLAKSPGQVFSKEQIYNQVWRFPQNRFIF